MAMIDRYKKAGGFMQLLNLLETCGPQKKEKFFAIIEEEASNWAAHLRKKVLTLERIYSWDSGTLTEIITRLQPLTLATALQGMDAARTEKVRQLLTRTALRQIDDRISSQPSGPAEIATANLKILTEVREMITRGILQLAKFDPELIIEEKIEELLATSALLAQAENTAANAAKDTSHEHPGDEPLAADASREPSRFDLKLELNSAQRVVELKNPAADHRIVEAHADQIEAFKRKIANLTTEMNDLKKENREFQEKLLQIKKFAS